MTIVYYPQLREIVPIGRTTLWRLEQKGLFPQRVRIGGRCGWRVDEVYRWLDAQPRGMAGDPVPLAVTPAPETGPCS